MNGIASPGMAWLAASALTLTACGACEGSPASTALPAQPNDLVFTGMCDASGAVALSRRRFVVADDEDNILRVYDSAHPGAPIEPLDVTTFLALPAKKEPQEADIEAATSVDGVGLWLTSHGLNSKGKAQAARFRMFATSLADDGPLTPVGTPYEQLLDDLLAAPQLAHLGLSAASQIAPKEPGGLNLEGMTARADNASVFIGFRNPRPRERAIVVPILNPRAIIEGQHANIGAPILLDLGGLGIRGLAYWRSRYLVLGGAIANEAESRLFVWDGEDTTPTPIASVSLSDFNPEGFVAYSDLTSVLLLSDDGSRLIDGEECKRITDVSRKRFRGRWVSVD